MNDDLHRTFEPESLSRSTGAAATSAGAWQMPEPVFRRSSGRDHRVAGAVSSAEAPQSGPLTSPEMAGSVGTTSREDPSATLANGRPELVEPEAVVDTAKMAGQTEPAKFPVWIIAVVLIALAGIFSAFAAAIYLGYVVWR